MTSARTRFIGTYPMSARPGWTEQLHQRRATGITAVLYLRTVPVRAFTDLRLTPIDTPSPRLIWDHENPYGRNELDMESRIPILA